MIVFQIEADIHKQKNKTCFLVKKKKKEAEFKLGADELAVLTLALL